MTTCQECCEPYSCPFLEVQEDNSKSISGNASEGLANKYEKNLGVVQFWLRQYLIFIGARIGFLASFF